MITIDIPEPSFQSVAFQPEAEYRKTLGPGTAAPLLERLSIANPIVVPLRPDQVYSDVRIAEYFRAKADQYRFSLVRLVCGFAPAPDEPITFAVLDVTLQPAQSPTSPVVVDMDPSKIADMSELKRSLEGGVHLEVAGGKVGFTVKQGSERPDAALFLVAAGIGKGHVGWEISATPGMRIGGNLVFNFIVQTSAGVPAVGQIAATVQVKRKHFGLIPYRALLDDHPAGSFVCPA